MRVRGGGLSAPTARLRVRRASRRSKGAPLEGQESLSTVQRRPLEAQARLPTVTYPMGGEEARGPDRGSSASSIWPARRGEGRTRSARSLSASSARACSSCRARGRASSTGRTKSSSTGSAPITSRSDHGDALLGSALLHAVGVPGPVLVRCAGYLAIGPRRAGASAAGFRRNSIVSELNPSDNSLWSVRSTLRERWTRICPHRKRHMVTG